MSSPALSPPLGHQGRPGCGRGDRAHPDAGGPGGDPSRRPETPMEEDTMPTQPCRAAALAALLAAGSATIALAQDPAVDPHHPEAGAPDATPPAGPAPGPAPGSRGQPDQPGMMGEGMMGGDMMAGVMG